MTRSMPALTAASTTKKYAANRKTAAITTAVVARTCFQAGQVTRRISALTSSMYDLVCCGQLKAFVISIAIKLNFFVHPECCRLCSTQQARALGRGRGIRTPTRGFGDRWSTVKPMPLFRTSLVQPIKKTKGLAYFVSRCG